MKESLMGKIQITTICYKWRKMTNLLVNYQITGVKRCMPFKGMHGFSCIFCRLYAVQYMLHVHSLQTQIQCYRYIPVTERHFSPHFMKGVSMKSVVLEVNLGARSSTVGWGTAPQVGRSWVRFPMVSLEFFIDVILLATLWPWGWLSL
jgi:hypothetical protein